MTKLNIHNCGGGATVEALLGGFCKISCDKCGAFVQAYGYEMTRELWNKRGDTVPFEDGCDYNVTDKPAFRVKVPSVDRSNEIGLSVALTRMTRERDDLKRENDGLRAELKTANEVIGRKGWSDHAAALHRAARAECKVAAANLENEELRKALTDIANECNRMTAHPWILIGAVIGIAKKALS